MKTSYYKTVLTHINSFLILALPIMTSLLLTKMISLDKSTSNNNILLTQHYWNKAKKTNQSISNNQIDSVGWYSQVMKGIKRSEYNITWQEEYNTYQSINRAQNLRFIYHNDGFTVKPRITKIPLFDQSDNMLKEEEKKYREIEGWQVKMNVTGYGRTAQNYNFTGKELKVTENIAEIEDCRMKIEYINNEEGMRQNFIIKERPEGEGSLKLNIAADTKLRMSANAEGAIFVDYSSEEKLKYNGLKVWDVQNRNLFAHFEKGINNNFFIVVNDDNAIYPITIDPLSTTANWTVEGNQASAWFGGCVSTAGDINGDGYSDVIIGADMYDNGQTDEGKAFVYYGSAIGLSQIANWTVESNQAGANFGLSVSTAGDVNNDGYSDVIIGAREYDNGQTDEGMVFVYHGSASGLSGTANWSIESNQVSAWFGHWVATAGDVNGDEFSDIIIGAPKYDSGQNDEGKAFVYHGSASGLSTSVNWSSESNQASAWFGGFVSTAGDVNGDGYSDVIIGAQLYDGGQKDEGKAFVYHGSPSGLSASVNWTAESNQSNAYFGIVSFAGDIDDDGYNDVIIGADYYDNGQTNEGKVFVYHGSASGLSTIPNWTAEINQANARFGMSVSTAGDVNGDGYSDIIIGSFWFDNEQVDEGGAFVYYGSISGLSAIPNWSAEGNQTNGRFGYCVSTAGDIDNDGFSDVIVGADLYDSGEIDEGKVFVYHGSSNKLNICALIEGFYDGMKMSRDTITIQIRNSNSPYSLVEQTNFLLDSQGLGSAYFKTTTDSVPYYLTIKHRNSLETWSATAQQFIAEVLNYDFTTASSQAYGDNLKLKGSKWCIYSGDVSQDGFVDLSDLTTTDNDVFNSASGYRTTDLNGDGVVNSADLNICNNNAINFIRAYFP